MFRISTIKGHERMSTQELLLKIAEAVEAGETEINVAASGQHDIGGPLWNKDGKSLHFTITNPGQRVGSMCLPGTFVNVEGPAPADAGWLNSGGIISIRGDAGDTAGHCAAAGKIYIGGRAGTRSGSLMKHDPEMEPPELWILNSTGSFSFEFMGGGKAVVCGHDSQILPSVLGERPCVGMVGGTVFFRGPHGDLPPDVRLASLDDEDLAWLDKGLNLFLKSIGQQKLKKELSFWKQWRKLEPSLEKDIKKDDTFASFHKNSWFKEGLFGDILTDNGQTAPLVPTGEERLARPERINEKLCDDCKECIKNCPKGAIRRKTDKISGRASYSVNDDKCIGCGFCEASCPKRIWLMRQM